MTPEERFDKIENVLHRTAEQQAQHEREMDKQNEAIRSLIVVSRTCLHSLQEFRDLQRKDHEEWTVQMKELRAAQAETGEKLNILVEHEEVLDRTLKSLAETVERILRKDNGQK